MRADDFSKLKESLGRLTARQREAVLSLLGAGSERKPVRELIERESEAGQVCAHCAGSHIVRWGASHGLPRFRCRGCGRTFNALTGTALARLRHKERWLDFAQSLIEGHSVRRSAAASGVHRNTAFRWRHRFLRLPSQLQAKVLSGIAEVDETFFLHSRKGQRKLPRKPRKRGGKASKRGRNEEHVAVVVARDRSGNTVNSVCSILNAETLATTLKPVLAEDVLLCSDGLSVYRSFAETNGIAHKALNLSAGIRVIDKVFHLQNVNAYHSRLKGWMRRFNGVATGYLPHYLGWFRWLDRQALQPLPKSLLLISLAVPADGNLNNKR